MTLTTQSIKAVAQGDSANTVWPFTFIIPEQSDLVVTLVDVASGNPTVLSPVAYIASGIGSPTGGTVTYPLSGPALTAATYIVVERYVPEVQETDLTNQGGAYPADIEEALDYLTMIAQQQQDQLDRSIVFSVADTVETTLPVASARAGLFLGFDSNGAPIAVAGIDPSVQVSAAMIPVVTAPTTAAALTALGLPGNLLDLLIPSGTEWDYNAGGAAPTGFVYPIGQPCTGLYPDYRAKLIAAGSPYGTNGTDPLMPDKRSVVNAGKSNMGGTDNGLLTGGTVLGALIGVQSFQLGPTNIPDLLSANPAAIALSVTTTQKVINGPNPGSAVGGGTQLTAADSGSGAQLSLLASTGTIAIGAAAVKTTTTSGSALGVAISKVQPTFICNKILKVH